MDLKPTRNAFFFAQAALFAVLFPAATGFLYLPGSVMLLLGVAFGLSGLVVVALTSRAEETGIRKLLFVLTGASAAAIPLTAILHNFIFETFLFFLALLVLPATFTIGWLGSTVLMACAERPISTRRKLMVGLVLALVVAVIVAAVTRAGGVGYSVNSELVNAPDEAIDRIYITVKMEEPLSPVFWRSFEHSLVSAFESNGVAAVIEIVREKDEPGWNEKDVEVFSPDAMMHISIDAIFRMHRDGYEAIVGTDFAATLTEMTTAERVWHLSGQVDYISKAYFKRHGYRAHEGVIKEFAWHTTAAIVRTFMVDVNGRQSAPIYTVTEDRQRHGQRTD